MVTIYDLLEVKENASKEEIEKSYQSLLIQYQTNPNLDNQENRENEMILNKLKMAYEILMNDEKRKKYDKDLAQKRAEELIKNVSVNSLSNSEKTENNSSSSKTNSSYKATTYNVKNNQKSTYNDEEFYDNDDDITLTKEEQKNLRKAAQKEFEMNLKKAKKAEQEYNQAYNEAYNNYMRKMGYNVKKPWTLKRIGRILLAILVIIIICVIAWLIPPIRNFLTNLYNENIIIKILVDLVVAIFKAITSIFK